MLQFENWICLGSEQRSSLLPLTANFLQRLKILAVKFNNFLAVVRHRCHVQMYGISLFYVSKKVVVAYNNFFFKYSFATFALNLLYLKSHLLVLVHFQPFYLPRASQAAGPQQAAAGGSPGAAQRADPAGRYSPTGQPSPRCSSAAPGPTGPAPIGSATWTITKIKTPN